MALKGACIIISELSIPNCMKTIKPITEYVGGKAGGIKYIWKNIFFKLSLNIDKLYRSDEELIKSFKNEIKGHNFYISNGNPKIRYPLTILIDILGWRIIAKSLLPIGHKTIIYGSSDGGDSIFNESEEFDKLIKQMSNQINITSEYVWENGKSKKVLLHSSCDTEGHKGYDGRFYIVDTARTLPPVYSNSDHAFLYQLMRPELVKKSPFKLCPDVYSGFKVENMEMHIRNNELVTNLLMNEIIPNFIQSFENQFTSSENIFNEQYITLMLTMMKNEGINTRYLPHLYSYSNFSNIKTLIEIEIISRCLKHKWRRSMREESMKELRCFKIKSIEFLNLVFGKSDHSFILWSVEIPKLVSIYFSGHPYNNFSNLKKIHSYFILTRISSLCGLNMDFQRISSSWEIMQKKLFPFNENDIISIEPRIIQALV